MRGLIMGVTRELKRDWDLAAIDLLNRSSTPHDYCRRLTLDPALGVGMRGNHLFLLSSAGTLQLMGGYGQYPYEETKEFSSFDDSVMAEAIRTRRVARRPFDENFDVQACPAIRADVVNGIILTVLESHKGGTEEFEMLERLERAYYLSLGLFIASAGFGPLEQVKRSATNEPLSERQMKILMGIGMGKTNLQIANELILSESSIKQETVKIFRSLGVANRQQAAIKARAMGSIPQETQGA
jgi:DNA-binding CsgD family transcriptional regulator